MKNLFKKLFAVALPFLVAGAMAAAETNVVDSSSPPEAPQPPAPQVTTQSNYPSAEKSVSTLKVPARRGPGPEMLIPIVAILSVFGFPVVLLIVLGRHKANREKRLHETIRLMIEKGTPIPPELLTPERKQPLDKEERKAGSDFRKGIQDVVFGIGVMIVISLLPISRFWPIGLIFIFIGAARLICWKVEKKTAQQEK